MGFVAFVIPGFGVVRSQFSWCAFLWVGGFGGLVLVVCFEVLLRGFGVWLSLWCFLWRYTGYSWVLVGGLLHLVCAFSWDFGCLLFCG